MKRILLALAVVGLLTFAGSAHADPYDSQGHSTSDEDSGRHSPANILIGIGAIAVFGFFYKMGSAALSAKKEGK